MVMSLLGVLAFASPPAPFVAVAHVTVAHMRLPVGKLPMREELGKFPEVPEASREDTQHSARWEDSVEGFAGAATKQRSHGTDPSFTGIARARSPPIPRGGPRE